MITRRSLAHSATLLSLTLLISSCDSTEKFRYKMTVEVETPEGVRTGYTVREMRYRDSGGFMFGEGRPQLQLIGEAVAVDFPEGRTLFALLTGQDGDQDYAGRGVSTIFRVLDRSIGPKGGPHELWPKVPVIQEPITDPLPMLVSFRDLNNPKSVERVDPEALDKVFGRGVFLKRITIQATDQEVEMRIDKRLGWLKRFYNRQLDGHRYNDSQEFSNSLNVLSFQQRGDQ